MTETPSPADRPVILFVNSNGVGLGHMTRLLAIARRLSPAVQPWFLTLAPAPGLIREFGIPADYMPSPSLFPGQDELWNRMFKERLSEMIGLLAARAVVFDGVYPYAGLIEARLAHRDAAFIWCRRGRWRHGGESGARSFEHYFNATIEPGESFSTAADSPPDKAITRVAPILLLDRDELADAQSADPPLGLEPDKDAVLVQLGAGNINALHSAAESSFAALRATFPSAQIGWSGSPISKSRPTLPGDVLDVSHYPISRYFKRFRFGISAAGYNSFHEHVAYGLPAVFIPNKNTITDDQYARACSAQRDGVAVVAEDDSEPALRHACAAMQELLNDPRLAERIERIEAPNGAREAAGLIETAATGNDKTAGQSR